MRVRQGASNHRPGSLAQGPEDGEKQTLVLACAGISLFFLNCTGTGLVKSRQEFGRTSAVLLPCQEHYIGQALNPLSNPMRQVLLASLPPGMETKTQIGSINCLRSHSKSMAELGFKPGLWLWFQYISSNGVLGPSINSPTGCGTIGNCPCL